MTEDAIPQTSVYGMAKPATLEALFLLGYREANSEGFSVWVLPLRFLDTTIVLATIVVTMSGACATIFRVLEES